MTTKQVTHEVRLQQWANVLRERKSSGSSVRRWCRENDINEKTYYYWQRKLRESVCENLGTTSEQPLVPAAFAQVRLPTQAREAGRLILRLNDAEVEIFGDMPASAIEAVIHALADR